jgi:hypothetical protein
MEAMDGTTDEKARPNEGHTTLALWIGALAPLFGWVLHSSVLSLFVNLGCESGSQAWLLSFTLIALAIDVAGGVIAWRGYRPTIGQPGAASAEVKRRRYFGLVGMLASIIFGIAIVAQTLMLSALAPC